jgi:hypothetical protein
MVGLLAQEAQEPGNAPSGLTLADAVQVGHEADDVAAPVASGEIGPAAGLEVDLEGAEGAIGAPWVAGEPFLPGDRRAAIGAGEKKEPVSQCD